MTSEYTSRLAVSAAVVMGLVVCTSYNPFPSVAPITDSGIRNRFNSGLDDLAVVDGIIRLKDAHGCLGVAKTPVKARESYLVLCKQTSSNPSDEQLAVDSVEDLVVAYRVNPTSRTN